MESMVTRLRPTRAEVSDISNAVYDGVDCCLLSSETQTGPFYKEACETMSKICYEAEKHIDYEKNYNDLQR
jgi:pyruvate kinase